MDLAFLATGYCQHTFTLTGGRDDHWVYKTPAAFGYVLPFRQPFEVFWPQTRLERALRFVFIAAPSGVQRRVCDPALARCNHNGSGTISRKAAAIRQSSRLLVRAGEKAVAFYCRRARLKQFLRMLDNIEFLAATNLDDVLLPCRIIRRGAARLHADGRVVQHRGPLLKQRRANVFEAGEGLDTFDWGELVSAQHRLWRNGVGFCHLREILGPQSWGVLDGRLYLADTSALTRDVCVARDHLSDSKLDVGERRAREQLKRLGVLDRADEYFPFVRSKINQQTFDRLWKADVK